MEAAACGMPVVYRDLREYELLYDNPYLKAADTEGFIQLTRRLIQDDAFYNKGLKISQQLITQFEKNEIRKAFLSLYSGVIQENNDRKRAIKRPVFDISRGVEHS